jgi:hypothetical protein
MNLKYLIPIVISIGFTNLCTGAQKAETNSLPKDDIKVELKDAYNPNAKKIATLNVFHSKNGKFTEKNDLLALTFGGIADGRLSEIYGGGVVGGDAIPALATKLKIKNFDESIKNLVDSQINNIPFTEASKQTIMTIITKGKIDAIAVPVISGNITELKEGGVISLSVIVYDGTKSNVQLVGSFNGIKASSDNIALAATKLDQASANMNAMIIEKTNTLMDAIQNTLKPNSVAEKKINDDKPKTADTESTSTASSTTNAGETSKDEKKEEPLSGLDNWLVNTVKVGLGPIVMGFTGFLFLIL